MNISFAKDAWNRSELTYAYSTRWEEFAEFTQEEACVSNQRSENSVLEYENIPLLTRQKYGTGTKITTRCAFESYGAPLIMLTGEMTEDGRGYLRFAEYLEVVLFEYGLNVWHLEKQNGKWVFTKLLGLEFSVTKEEIHTLSVEVQEKSLNIQADDRKLSLYIPNLYKSFYAGIAACEGINRFYGLEIEGPQK